MQLLSLLRLLCATLRIRSLKAFCDQVRRFTDRMIGPLPIPYTWKARAILSPLTKPAWMNPSCRSWLDAAIIGHACGLHFYGNYMFPKNKKWNKNFSKGVLPKCFNKWDFGSYLKVFISQFFNSSLYFSRFFPTTLWFLDIF